MNIFVLDECPVQSAQMQCDKHVVKMVLESAQMLSTAHRMLDGELVIGLSPTGRKQKQWVLPDQREEVMYKVAHPGHPCTIWTMESRENYDWHFEHFFALCREYQKRYNKQHLCEKKLLGHLCDTPKNIPQRGQTPFAIAMQANPECILNNAVESYRCYYKIAKKRFAKWERGTEAPAWWQGEE